MYISIYRAWWDVQIYIESVVGCIDLYVQRGGVYTFMSRAWHYVQICIQSVVVPFLCIPSRLAVRKHSLLQGGGARVSQGCIDLYIQYGGMCTSIQRAWWDVYIYIESMVESIHLYIERGTMYKSIYRAWWGVQIYKYSVVVCIHLCLECGGV